MFKLYHFQEKRLSPAPKVKAAPINLDTGARMLDTQSSPEQSTGVAACGGASPVAPSRARPDDKVPNSPQQYIRGTLVVLAPPGFAPGGTHKVTW